MITLSQKQQNFAGNVGKLLTYIYNKGFSVSLGECYRTPEQAALYAKQGKGIVNSLHCKKLAITSTCFGTESISRIQSRINSLEIIGAR